MKILWVGSTPIANRFFEKLTGSKTPVTSQKSNVFGPSKAQTLDTTPYPERDMASPNQLAANRANAQLSTGPTSSEGKAKVSHNALKTGLTGRTVLLPTDDVAAYKQHVERVLLDYQPATDAENTLVYSSDYPHWDFDTPSVIYDLPFLTDQARRNILGGNACRLFGLPTQKRAPKSAIEAGLGGYDTVEAAPTLS